MSNVLHPPRGDGQDDRRRHPRLRELVDEMLAGIRVAANRELWTDDERSRAAAELAGIMERVRQEALAADAAPAAGPAGVPRAAAQQPH